MVRQIFRVGPLATVADEMSALLYDPLRTGLVLVTLPEEMPVLETLELRNGLRAKHGIDTAAIIVNGVYPELLDHDELAALAGAVQGEAALEADDAVSGVLWAADVLRGRADRAARLMPDLREAVGERLIELPHLFRRHMPLDAIDELARKMRGAA